MSGRRDRARGTGAAGGPDGAGATGGPDAAAAPAQPPVEGPVEGPDPASAALARARAAARERGARPSSRPGPAGTGRPGVLRGGGSGWSGSRAGPGSSGAGPDARDPQTLASALGRLVGERGWRADVAVGGVVGRWSEVVGADVAAHCVPVEYADGVLVVAADSTAWATQVRLLASAVLRRLGEEVGEGVVRELRVRGPASPTWRGGGRWARDGRGPRDTYG